MSVVSISPSGGDDSAAIINAINALSPEGGIVTLEPGTYSIQTTIVVTKSGVKLRGSEGGRGQ